MTESRELLSILRDEAGAARAHFHTWWALRNMAIPEYFDTMNNYEFVDFFHVSNSGNYKLIFISLAKIFDRDSRTAGIVKLKNVLIDEGHQNLADEITNRLGKKEELIKKILRIRNQSISHNQSELPREKVYKINDITPDQIREVIDETCSVMNDIASAFGMSTVISDADRLEQATLNMLRQLKNGKT